MKLIKWLTSASQEVVKSENKVETFLRLRYDEMNRLFPHDPFGIDRASMSFFDDAISDLTIPGNLKKRIDSGASIPTLDRTKSIVIYDPTT